MGNVDYKRNRNARALNRFFIRYVENILRSYCKIASQNPIAIALILSIESSTEVCSVALAHDGHLLALAETQERNAHSRMLTILIGRVMREADRRLDELDAVALSSGPGSYTSLRVGASTAKGICFALNKPLLAIDTLRALADGVRRQEIPEAATIIPMIDARRMEVYCSVYDEQMNLLQKKWAEVVTEGSFGTFFAFDKPVIFTGNGADKCRSVLTAPLARFAPLSCSARYLVPLAETDFRENCTVDAAYFTPEYVKQPYITTPRKRSLR